MRESVDSPRVRLTNQLAPLGRWGLGMTCLLTALCIACADPLHKRSGPDTPAQTGVYIPTFGTSGVVATNPSSGTDELRAAIEVSGPFVLVGGDEVTGVGDLRWRIEKRRTSDGSLDASFGSGGIVTSNPSTGIDVATSIATDGTYLYIGGFDSTPGDRQWRVEKRLLLDGSLDTAFGVGGILTVNPSTGRDEISIMAVYDTSGFFAIGFDESAGVGDFQWRIEKRALTTGALVAAYGSGGVVTSNPSSGDDMPTCLASDLIGGFDSVAGNRRWRVERRGLTDGAFNSGFGTSGVLTVDPGSGNDEILAATIDWPDVLLAGSDSSPGGADVQWRVERRSATTGSLASGFGTGGVMTSNPSSGIDIPTAVRRHAPSEFHVVGTDESIAAGDWQWRMEKRVATTGALVPTFGQGGIVTSNPTSGDDRPVATPLALYVAGTANRSGDSSWRIEARSP